ncbi:hypothetical protein F5Y06DRAFT_268874 [Hypoxylon sp. FL0890]|nr:hypothetical protein F5Y06DRAFT_268874 [Hypoxylon sp. FL0890]
MAQDGSTSSIYKLSHESYSQLLCFIDLLWLNLHGNIPSTVTQIVKTILSMDLSSINSSNPSELYGSGNIRGMASHMDGMSHHQQIDNRQPPNYHDIVQSCPFHDRVVEECYRHGLYAIAVELLFLLETNPTPIRSDCCLMASCPEGNFKNAQEMLLHLRSCKHYSKRVFRCPTYDTSEKSQTVPKKCPLDVLKLSQKFQDKLRDFVRNIMSTRPMPKESPTPEPHGQQDSQPSVPESLPCQTLPELPADQGLLCELQGGMLSDQQNPPRRDFYTGELYGSPSLITDQSTSFNSPVELPSAIESLYATYPTDMSPASFVKSPVVAATGQMQYECLPNDLNQHADWCWNGNHAKQECIHWNPLSSTQPQPHNVPSSFLPAALPSSSVHHGGLGPSLTLQTNLEPNMDAESSAWELSHSSGSSWLDTMDCEESPTGGSLSMPTSSMNTSPLSNTDTSTDSLEAAEGDVGSDQPPGSAHEEPEPPCPHCNYKPRGKKENFPAYIRKHLLKHEVREKIKCEDCHKEFTRRDNCGVHFRKAHLTSCDHKRRPNSPCNHGDQKRTKSVSQ